MGAPISRAMTTASDYLDKKVDSSASAETQDRTSGDFPAIGEDLTVDEKKLVRKLDLHLIPIVMLTYLLSFLDRYAPPFLSLPIVQWLTQHFSVNIGNSRLYNMEKDLGLVGNQYQIAVSILFVTYIMFEVPSNLVLKKFTPSRWISFITFSWGIVATLTGLVQSYGGLIVCRVLLGALEAGMFPGMSLYLTFWYTKTELALRVGYLFVSAAIAGALGGLLAFGIGRMDGLQGMSGWRVSCNTNTQYIQSKRTK
jgi:MFS family permease